MRLLDVEGATSEVYGYHDFGLDLYGNQGKKQPFGYTGYLIDPVTDTYFAQMREYMPWAGRFTGQDLIKGYQELPYSLNEYTYCWNNPEKYVDKDGRFAFLIIAAPAVIGAIAGIGGQVVHDIAQGEVSSWQDYVGSGVGGAVGGFVGTKAGPIAGGASASGTSELIAGSLKKLTGESKLSWGMIAKRTVASTATGAITGKLSKGIDKYLKGFNNYSAYANYSRLLTRCKNGNAKYFRNPKFFAWAMAQGIGLETLESMPESTVKGLIDGYEKSID